MKQELNTLDRINTEDIKNIIMSYEKSRGTKMNEHFENTINVKSIMQSLFELEMLESLMNTKS